MFVAHQFDTRSNLCPDERGLKAKNRYEALDRDCEVATYAPMKRGLKDEIVHGNAQPTSVATYAPMKRGLKG